MARAELSFDITHVGLDEALASARSVADALLPPNRISQALVDELSDLLCRGVGDASVELRLDGRDLVRIEVVDGTACRENEISLRIQPNDRYRELVAAIGRDLDCRADDSVHGWPILSIGDRTPIVAEAGGAANAPGEGLPA